MAEIKEIAARLQTALDEAESARSEFNGAQKERADALKNIETKVNTSRQKMEQAENKAQAIRQELDNAINEELPRQPGRVSG